MYVYNRKWLNKKFLILLKETILYKTTDRNCNLTIHLNCIFRW